MGKFVLKKFLENILFLLGDDKKSIPGMMFIFFISSFLDLIGLGLIGPYISLLSGEENIFSNFDLISPIIYLLESFNYEFVLTLGFVLIIVFIVKAIASIWINAIIIKFSLIT